MRSVVNTVNSTCLQVWLGDNTAFSWKSIVELVVGQHECLSEQEVAIVICASISSPFTSSCQSTYLWLGGTLPAYWLSACASAPPPPYHLHLKLPYYHPNLAFCLNNSKSLIFFIKSLIGMDYPHDFAPFVTDLLILQCLCKKKNYHWKYRRMAKTAT